MKTTRSRLSGEQVSRCSSIKVWYFLFGGTKSLWHLKSFCFSNPLNDPSLYVLLVLYIRRLYPQESFCPTIFLDIKCRVNRHPEVVEYISQTVEMAMSAVSTGDSQEISMILFDQATAIEYETYRICFNEKVTYSDSRKGELERELRYLLLSVHALEGLKNPRWPQEATFRVMILLPAAVKNSTILKQALQEGSWYSPGDESSKPLGPRRPIHEMRDFGFRLYSEVMDSSRKS